MNAVKRRQETLISKRLSAALALVDYDELPPTFLNMLVKALPHAIDIDGCLLLPVDSLRIELCGGVCVTGEECVNLLLHSKRRSLDVDLH